MAPPRRTLHRQNTIEAGSFQEGGIKSHQAFGRLQIVVEGGFMNRMVPAAPRGDGGGIRAGRGRGKGSSDE